MVSSAESPVVAASEIRVAVLGYSAMFLDMR